MMNEDAQTLSSESQNFMWRLEGIMFEEETFFLKVGKFYGDCHDLKKHINTQHHKCPKEFMITSTLAKHTRVPPISCHLGDKKGSPWPVVFLCSGDHSVSQVQISFGQVTHLHVQMVGSAAEVARFGVTMIVFRFPNNLKLAFFLTSPTLITLKC